MKRGAAILAAACMLALLLTGCLFKSAEELYTLPRLSADYANLQDELGTLINTGLEYAAPISGDNTQPIQFQDLDGDGTDEVVAFFRDSSGTKPIRIYIFRRSDEGLYQNVAQIQGDGSAIQSVVYENLDSSEEAELVVNYQISDQVYTLYVYSLVNYTPTELFSSGCTRYAASDFDQDGRCELVLFQTNDSGRNQAEYYDCSEDVLHPVETVLLSESMSSISRLLVSNLAGETPAIYVTGDYASEEGRIITDVLSVSGGTLKNITLDESTGDSTGTVRTQAGEIFATDINSDGICEIPFARELTQLGSENVWMVRWLQYDANGSSTLACATIWAPEEGWYLTVPESWIDRVSVQREDSSISSETELRFYGFPENTEISEEALEDEQEPFLTVYTLSGSSRLGQGDTEEGRVSLLTQSDLLCTALVDTEVWGSAMSETEVKQNFHQIPSDWSDSD